MIKGRPPRLYRVFPDAPLYFVTFCTRDRKRVLSLYATHNAFQAYAAKALDQFNVAVGRYVIMPDHIHLFVRGGPNFLLARWVSGLKRAISVKLGLRNQLWQPGFFDHVLRSDESYGEKWQYVRENPVRAGLTAQAEDWSHQGEFVVIDRA
ncbi:MAG TPA: transposase [Chthoniobacterales bacterium]|nr:transposase [Chthoniobacterales bacterium]